MCYIPYYIIIILAPTVVDGPGVHRDDKSSQAEQQQQQLNVESFPGEQRDEVTLLVHFGFSRYYNYLLCSEKCHATK